MASIEIARVGDSSDLSALKRNFVSVLQDHFNPQGKKVPSFSKAIAARGINEKTAIRNLRRRARYHQQQDRPKYFASCTYIPTSSYMYNKTQPVIDQDVSSLRNPSSTAAYVSAWCRLNHLKEN